MHVQLKALPQRLQVVQPSFSQTSSQAADVYVGSLLSDQCAAGSAISEDLLACFATCLMRVKQQGSSGVEVQHAMTSGGPAAEQQVTRIASLHGQRRR